MDTDFYTLHMQTQIRNFQINKETSIIDIYSNTD